jgi:Ca2+-binding RTX toxin-like protein
MGQNTEGGARALARLGNALLTLFGLLALATVIASGVALADNIEGNGANNRLVGTNGKDTISGGGGADSIFGKGGSDRLFGDSGNDDIHGGNGNDRLQVGTGQDELFGQGGFDFVNAIDLQTNDRVDCGPGDDIAGIDDFTIFIPVEEADFVAPNCEILYVGVPDFVIGPASAAARGESGTDLSAIDTRAEAEQAEADGLLKQIR